MNTNTEITWKDVTRNEIRTFASTHNAVEFNDWCDTQGIDCEWLEVTLTDFNDGYYNVVLSEYDLNVMYYDGVLEEITEL
jgi:hypothetical protein